MKVPTFILTVLSILGSLVLRAQDPQIIADVTQGCDSLKVNFSFATSISSVTSILWNFGDGTTDNVASPQKNYRKPGSYTVSLTLNGTATSLIPVNIMVGKTPNRDSLNLHITYRDTSVLGPDTYVIGVSYNNNHPFPYSYQWSIDGVVTDIKSSFVHTFDSAGIYKIRLVMTDQVGCSATFNDSIDLLNNIDVPNVFTPNDDGINEVFKIKSSGKNVLSLKIFTRTGLLIYKTEANSIEWDGRLPSGDRVLPGIYYYIVETIKASPAYRKTGFFYLYR